LLALPGRRGDRRCMYLGVGWWWWEASKFIGGPGIDSEGMIASYIPLKRKKQKLSLLFSAAMFQLRTVFVARERDGWFRPMGWGVLVTCSIDLPLPTFRRLVDVLAFRHGRLFHVKESA
jgi:hypothetical protein